MTANETAINLAPLEQLAGQVRGVQAVRLVPDEHGQIAEIHVVGTPERSPKSIVRDIESILFVRGGVRVSHRKISLVQIPETALVAGARVQFVGVDQVAAEMGEELTVTLAISDRRIAGVAMATIGVAEQTYAVAVATIAALSQIVGERGRFVAERIEQHPFGALSVCLAHVSLSIDETLETLLGISVVREDVRAAAARAVLDAVNRRLPGLLGSQRR
jgi:hypothetical protein